MTKLSHMRKENQEETGCSEIKVRGEKVGKILYESKKTKSFSSKWLH